MRIQPAIGYMLAAAVGATIGAGVTFAALRHRQETYNDCVIENLKPGMTNAVGSAVVQACYRKYPQPYKTNPFDQFDKK